MKQARLILVFFALVLSVPPKAPTIRALEIEVAYLLIELELERQAERLMR